MRRVVIAGAGVIGLMCAYELQRSGFEVTVLDRSEPGSGCSSGNMGWIVPSFARPLPAPGLAGAALRWMLDPGSPLYIKPRADLDLARWLWAFSRRCNTRDHAAGVRALAGLARPSLGALTRLRADGVEFEVHNSGVLFLFLSGAARDHVYSDLASMTTPGNGDAPERLTGDQVRESEPRVQPRVAAGIFLPQERHVRPESLIAGLLARVRARGAELRTGVEVLGARLRGSAAAALMTNGGEMEGDAFLLTAGVWTGALARAMGVAIPLQGGKGYSLTIERPAWQPTHALYLDEARVACSPFAGCLRVGGTMEFSGLNTRVDARRLEAIRSASKQYLRGWPEGAGETAWAGLRPLTPDGLPVLGRLGRLDNVFVATGHGMLGMTLAPSTGLLMAELIRTGTCEADLTPFRADRFGRARS